MFRQALFTAFVYLDVEQSYRRNFLEDALIGELVARDSLSGLMNRRAFGEHLLRVWQHALRDERVVALIMIDIDHFKPYHDAFGHQRAKPQDQAILGVRSGRGNNGQCRRGPGDTDHRPYAARRDPIGG
jgi:PleD family two-component response regulator